MMKKQNKTVRDAEKVTKEFFAALDKRRGFFNYSDQFTIGYLEGFLKMNADQKLLEAMEQRMASLKDVA